ncbi:MAG TPA: Nif3-like dinuclear metal center hexameric protein [Victivallales bacterium]|nr:Nif3-like dinuclear metal center hexameric protein [Victivallales bacterium]
MIQLNELVEYLDNLLEIDLIAKDHSNNGLQVQGNSEVKKIIFGVDASIEMIEIAEKLNADFIFVHHGISWGSNLKYISGNNYSRINPLIKNDISLYGAHLPLDAHPVIGHNAKLADLMGLNDKEMFCQYGNTEIGVKGTLQEPVSVSELNKYLDSKLGLMIKNNCSNVYSKTVSEHNYIMDNSEKGLIQKIGIISGGAGSDGVLGAIDAGLDCLITGEFGHSTYYTAKENGLSIIAPGHYKTEVPGIIAVMEKINAELNIETEFVNIPTGL